MGFKQTASHRFGKGSYHQIGLVRGQFGNVPMDKWLDFIRQEPASTAGKKQAGNSTSINARPTAARKRMPRNASSWPRNTTWKSSRSRRICRVKRWATNQVRRRFSSRAAKRGRRTRRGATKGTSRRAPNPYFVPDEVGKLIHDQSQRDLIACVRLAHFFGKLQNRTVPLPGFVGSPAHCWSHFFLFPPLPASLEGHAIADVTPGQPGVARRAFRPRLGCLQEVWRDVSISNAIRANERWGTLSRRAITSTSS